MKVNDIIVLLILYMGFKEHGFEDQQWFKNSIDNLRAEDLVENHPTNGLQTTLKGQKYAQMLKATPLPQQLWVDPREDRK